METDASHEDGHVVIFHDSNPERMAGVKTSWVES